MKNAITAAVSCTLLILFSCREDAEISSRIDGRWKGTLLEVQVKPFGLPIPITKEDPTFRTEIEFGSNGTMAIWDGGTATEGTYELADDKLTTEIDYSIEGLNLSETYTLETLTDAALVFFLEKRDTTIVDPNGGASVNGRVKVTLHFERL